MNMRKKLLCCGVPLAAVLMLSLGALAASAEETFDGPAGVQPEPVADPAAPLDDDTPLIDLEEPYIPEEMDVPSAENGPTGPLPEAPADGEDVSAELPPAASEDISLLLVNAWNPIPEGYQVELAALDNGLQVDKRIYESLNTMLADCRAAGLDPIVCSAYRTESTQTRLYNNKVARVRASGVPEDQVEAEAARWVAPPGTSEHQTGLAVDIVAASYQILDEAQEDTAEQQWLMENSWKYGFILRYPVDKGDITGIGYEPWHYRYVGREPAESMYRSGLCLEEYLCLLEADAQPETVPGADSSMQPQPEETAGCEEPELNEEALPEEGTPADTLLPAEGMEVPQPEDTEEEQQLLLDEEQQGDGQEAPPLADGCQETDLIS